ncbi:MAG: AlpA family phage regulatory protein [Tateyamaria sp.]|jgi:prophage regulatory protein|nr:AlpA family phage regulatory protein [Tateyamaria sp.]
MSPSKLLKAKDVSDLTSISRSHLHRLAREGKFPKPIKIGENRSAWLEADVQDWITTCVRKHQVGQ